MNQYPVIKRIRFSHYENDLMNELKSKGVNITQFIRQALKEKSERDLPGLISNFEKQKTKECPF